MYSEKQRAGASHSANTTKISWLDCINHDRAFFMRLKNKTILITGGASGIGLATRWLRPYIRCHHWAMR